LTREPNYSRVSRIRFVYQKQILGDCYEKDYSRFLSFVALLALALGTSFASHDMACCKHPAMECLQKPGYAMLPVNASGTLVSV